MPPKGKQDASKGGDKDGVEKEKEILQAVVLADSYNHRFGPLSRTKPRCLLPLCNTPLLSWTLESLSIAGVDEVIIFCTTKSDQIKAAISESRFSSASSSMKLTPIVSSSAISPGDALRELDSYGIIKSDFILLSGDLVSNLSLKEAIEAHKARRLTTKDCIMTMLVKEGGLNRSIRPAASGAVYTLSQPPPAESSPSDTTPISSYNRLLAYESVPLVPKKKKVHLPGTVFDRKRGIEKVFLRNDLVDCGIDVCSVDVPALFTENFDYASLRQDFVNGILTSDALGKQIHCHFAGKGYAARVRDLKSYDGVSRDVIGRWTFPLVPDVNEPGMGRYELREGQRYISKRGVVLSRSCTIGPKTMIGPLSQIQDKSKLSSSVIGSNVIIHPNCTITNSYIWDDVVIGEGSVINNSVIGSNVKIGPRVTIGKGSLIGDGVEIEGERTLPEFIRIAKKPMPDEDEDEDEEDEEDEQREMDGQLSSSLGSQTFYSPADDDSSDDSIKIVGETGRGFVWMEELSSIEADADSDLEEDPLEFPPNKLLLGLARTTSNIELSDSEASILSESSVADDDEDDIDTDEDGGVTGHPDGTTLTTLTLGEEGDPAQFRIECSQTLDHAFSKGGKVDKESLDFAALQIKSARSTTNVGPGIVREVILGYLIAKGDVSTWSGDDEDEKRKSVGRNWGPLARTWGPLLSRFAEEDAEKEEILRYLLDYCLEHPDHAPFFGAMMAVLCLAGVVDNDTISSWKGCSSEYMSGLTGTEKTEMVSLFRQWAELDSYLNDESSDEEDDEDEEESD